MKKSLKGHQLDIQLNRIGADIVVKNPKGEFVLARELKICLKSGCIHDSNLDQALEDAGYEVTEEFLDAFEQFENSLLEMIDFLRQLEFRES